MKPRRAPMRRTPIERHTPIRQGKPLARTEFKQTGSIFQSGVGNASRVNGPTKTRIESPRIPKPIRDAVLDRDDRCCQRCGIGLIGKRYSLQHRDPRGAGGSRLLHTVANLVALCGTGTTECHGHVESYRDEAKALGWLVPDGVTPEEWPVYRFGREWAQPGDEWTAAVPHPRQREMGAPVGAEGGTPA